MDHRSCAARALAAACACTALLAAAGPVRGQAAWTERDVVQRAVERSAELRVARAAHALARAEQVAPSLRPDPSVSWEREQVLAPSVVQDVVRLSLPLDLSSRTRTRTALARVRAAFARAEIAGVRARVVQRALGAFDAALAADRRAALAAAALEAVEEAARVVRAREAQGTGAGYDVLRLEIEAELLRSREADARAAGRIARVELAAILEVAPERAARLTGSLESRDAGGPGRLVDRALRRRAELRAARQSLGVARAAVSGTSRAWLPQVVLSGGLDVQHGAGDDAYGYVGSASVEVPLSSRGQDGIAEARASRDLAAAIVAELEARVRREVRVARERLVAARGELSRLDQGTGSRVAALRAAAEAGYREGARSVTELLDARRAVLEVESRRLELAVRARRADVALRLAVGELP